MLMITLRVKVLCEVVTPGVFSFHSSPTFTIPGYMCSVVWASESTSLMKHFRGFRCRRSFFILFQKDTDATSRATSRASSESYLSLHPLETQISFMIPHSCSNLCKWSQVVRRGHKNGHNKTHLQYVVDTHKTCFPMQYHRKLLTCFCGSSADLSRGELSSLEEFCHSHSLHNDVVGECMSVTDTGRRACRLVCRWSVSS